MDVVEKFIMTYIPVEDMPKSKEFYAEKLGLKIVTDYRQDDKRWWVALTFPKSEFRITISTFYGQLKPGNAQLYFSTPDIEAAHKELSTKDVEITDIEDNLFGPGSGVKWFNVTDPDGNKIYMAELKD